MCEQQREEMAATGKREMKRKRQKGGQSERTAQWWANCSAVTQAPAYVELNIFKKHTHTGRKS